MVSYAGFLQRRCQQDDPVSARGHGVCESPGAHAADVAGIGVTGIDENGAHGAGSRKDRYSWSGGGTLDKAGMPCFGDQRSPQRPGKICQSHDSGILTVRMCE